MCYPDPEVTVNARALTENNMSCPGDDEYVEELEQALGRMKPESRAVVVAGGVSTDGGVREETGRQYLLPELARFDHARFIKTQEPNKALYACDSSEHASTLMAAVARIPTVGMLVDTCDAPEHAKAIAIHNAESIPVEWLEATDRVAAHLRGGKGVDRILEGLQSFRVTLDFTNDTERSTIVTSRFMRVEAYDKDAKEWKLVDTPPAAAYSIARVAPGPHPTHSYPPRIVHYASPRKVAFDHNAHRTHMLASGADTEPPPIVRIASPNDMHTLRSTCVAPGAEVCKLFPGERIHIEASIRVRFPEPAFKREPGSSVYTPGIPAPKGGIDSSGSDPAYYINHSCAPETHPIVGEVAECITERLSGIEPHPAYLHVVTNGSMLPHRVLQLAHEIAARPRLFV